MNQWYPPAGNSRPGPGGQRGTTEPPAAGAEDHGYGQGGAYPGHAPTTAYGQPGPAATQALPEQYRRLRARTTRMTAYSAVLACAILIFLVAGAGHYSASSGALGASVLLVNIARIFQLLARRKRIASMTGTPDAGGPQHARHAGSPVPAAYDMPAAPDAPAAAEFSQQFCSVTRVTAGGNLNAGIPDADFLVRIADGWLSVTEAPAIPVFNVPASEVQPR
jgi:hypothetical protein